MTHPPRVAENFTTHPLHKAQNIMTYPLSALAHPFPNTYFLTRYAYNHVFLEKTSLLYQIRSLTRLKLRIYFELALFHRLSHSWQAIKCTNRIWPDLAFGFVNKRSGYGISVNPHSYETGNKPIGLQSNNASAAHLNSLALISFLVWSWSCSVAFSIALFPELMLEN